MDEEVLPANEPELNAEILDVLGKEVTSAEKLVGPALQKEVATRWLGVAKWGLSEEERKNLIDLYPVPENCPLAAPKLNLEVKAAINESVLRRDMRMVKRQNHIGASLSAIGYVITSILKKKEGEHLTYIKQLSDASRLLLDLHHQETESRRDLASLNLNKELKDTLTNAPADEWLFGAALDERVRATRTLEKSGQELKAPRSKVVVKRPNMSRPLNFKSLPRQQLGVRQGGRNQSQTPRNQPQTPRNQMQTSRNQHQYHHRNKERDRRTLRGRMGTYSR